MNQIKRLLTENGKNFINCHNKKGYTPVHYSVMDDDFIMCKFLIDSGADVNRPSKCLACKLQPLYYAVIRGNAEICQMLLSHGAINGRVDAMGNCYLHYAAYYAHPGVCEVLLDPKASWSTSPDLYNDHGETPLYWSVKYGRVSVCKLLLSRSADWEIATAYGSTVLDVAEHPEIIDLISKVGNYIILFLFFNLEFQICNYVTYVSSCSRGGVRGIARACCTWSRPPGSHSVNMTITTTSTTEAIKITARVCAAR
jgi:palmitoyltransferase